MESPHILTTRSMQIDPRGVLLFSVQVALLIICWTFFTLRMLVRVLVVRGLSLDDVFMTFAILIYTAHATVTLWGIEQASYQGSIDPVRGEYIALYSWFICEILYAPLSALTRCSVAYFLLRIAVKSAHRAIIYTTLASTAALSIAFFWLLLFQCWPVSHFYEQALGQDGTCMNANVVPTVSIVHSVISASTDFLLASLPVAILWDVRLDIRTKMGVAALLSMGFLAGIALLVRIPMIQFIPISSPHFLDQTSSTGLWSVMETSLGIVAGCAATLRPLLRGFDSRDQHPDPPRGTPPPAFNPIIIEGDDDSVLDYIYARRGFDAHGMQDLPRKRHASGANTPSSLMSFSHSAVLVRTDIKVKEERLRESSRPPLPPLPPLPCRQIAVNERVVSGLDRGYVCED